MMPQQSPTLVPGVVDTIVAQTAAAAWTQTAALIPPTRTPSFTPLPTKTASVTPSPTETFIFKLNTPTQVKPSATPNSSKAGYACDLVSQSPDDGTVFNANTDFDAHWTVKNIGSKNWSATSVDVIYVSGSKFYKKNAYDLSTSVATGSTYTVAVDMVAPKNSGSYTTHWGLRVNKNVFCAISLNIVVP